MRSSFLLDSLVDQMLMLGPFSLTLHSDDPGDTGEFAVARQPALLRQSGVGEIVNAETVEFGPMPAGDVTHIGVWGAERFLMGIRMPSRATVEDGQYLRWSPDTIVIEFD